MAGVQSDVIVNSLGSLSKAKRSLEDDLRAEIKQTNQLKKELSEMSLKLAAANRDLAVLQDQRKVAVDKSNELITEAARLEQGNKESSEKVMHIDRQMLTVREQQRITELSYSGRVIFLAEKFRSGKAKYHPDSVQSRTEEMRGRKEELVKKCLRLHKEVEAQSNQMEVEDADAPTAKDIWSVIRECMSREGVMLESQLEGLSHEEQDLHQIFEVLRPEE